MVFYNNKWIEVEEQRMDALIVVDGYSASCRKLRDIKQGDMIVCGDTGVKLSEESQNNEEDNTFSFMNNYVSSERRNDMLIQSLAYDLFYNNKKINHSCRTCCSAYRR